MKSAELKSFIYRASGISIPAFSGFGGLDRSQIKLSFENLSPDFFELTNYEDIGWAVEFLDESLKKYFSKKKEG